MGKLGSEVKFMLGFVFASCQRIDILGTEEG